MNISHLSLSDFRNFHDLHLDLAPINIFIGLNAQGKSNILEAVHFASLGSSRASHFSDLIRWGSSSALIRIAFLRAAVSHSLAISLSLSTSRRFLLDSSPIPFRSLIGRLPSVFFSPDHLFLFKGSPAARRKFLDAAISQSSAFYFSDLLTFHRLLSHRNSLLRLIRERAADTAALPLWNEQLASLTATVLVKRLDAVEKLDAARESGDNYHVERRNFQWIL